MEKQRADKIFTHGGKSKASHKVSGSINCPPGQLKNMIRVSGMVNRNSPKSAIAPSKVILPPLLELPSYYNFMHPGQADYSDNELQRVYNEHPVNNPNRVIRKAKSPHNRRFSAMPMPSTSTLSNPNPPPNFIRTLQETNYQIDEDAEQLQEIKKFIKLKKTEAFINHGKPAKNKNFIELNKIVKLKPTYTEEIQRIDKMVTNLDRRMDLKKLEAEEKHERIKRRDIVERNKKLEKTLSLVDARLEKLRDKYPRDEPFALPHKPGVILHPPGIVKIKDLFSHTKNAEVPTMEASRILQKDFEKDLDSMTGSRYEDERDFKQLKVLYKNYKCRDDNERSRKRGDKRTEKVSDKHLPPPVSKPTKSAKKAYRHNDHAIVRTLASVQQVPDEPPPLQMTSKNRIPLKKVNTLSSTSNAYTPYKELSKDVQQLIDDFRNTPIEKKTKPWDIVRQPRMTKKKSVGTSTKNKPLDSNTSKSEFLDRELAKHRIYKANKLVSVSTIRTEAFAIVEQTEKERRNTEYEIPIMNIKKPNKKYGPLHTEFIKESGKIFFPQIKK